MTHLPTLLFLEHVLWHPGEEWDSALRDVATRFARVSSLDTELVRAAGALHAQLDALASWAAAAGVDLDRELGRWFDEHLAMHVRPAPPVTRAVRALAASAPVHLVSALPARAAESIARHAGCWRALTELHAPVRDAASLEQLIARLGPAAVLAGEPSPLPAGVSRGCLGAPIV